jgi:hypothetical protein
MKVSFEEMSIAKWELECEGVIPEDYKVDDFVTLIQLKIKQLRREGDVRC